MDKVPSVTGQLRKSKSPYSKYDTLLDLALSDAPKGGLSHPPPVEDRGMYGSRQVTGPKRQGARSGALAGVAQ